MSDQENAPVKSAYDMGELLDELKKHGLDLAEDAAEKVLIAVLDWFEKAAMKSENKYDDLALAVLPILKSQALPIIDKIDGEDDPNR